jgi:hypothetical protein
MDSGPAERSNMWKTICFEKTGLSHKRSGLPCQDKTFSLSTPSGFSAIALSDGAGSASHSHCGARAASMAACEYLKDHFEEIFEEESAEAGIAGLLNHLREKLRAEATLLGCDFKALASTLLAAAVSNDRYILFHLGDGVIAYLLDDKIKVASTPSNGSHPNETYFLTEENCYENAKMFKGYLGRINSFILMSDGTASTFYNPQGRKLDTSLKTLSQVLVLMPECNREALLTECFETISKNTKDDCSLSIICTGDRAKFAARLTSADRSKIVGMMKRKSLNRMFYIYHLCSESPKTSRQLSRHVHLKHKYTLRKLNRLVEYGLILKKNNKFYVEV